MATVWDFLGDLLAGAGAFISHNAIGLILAAMIGLFLWIKYGKPKPVNEIDQIFNKEWETSVERLRLKDPKKLLITSWPIDIAELKKTPLHQIHYEYIADVIGINAVCVRNSAKSIIGLSKKLTDAELQDFFKENEEAIKEDRFWIVFAIRKRIGGNFLFKKIRRTLLYCKPNQLIEVNSRDDAIRVRGVGISAIGPYELITDFTNPMLHIKQLNLDKFDQTWDEVNLKQTARFGEIMDKAMNMDTDLKKGLMFRGLDILQKQEGQEIKT
jgi:hypothetical protein